MGMQGNKAEDENLDINWVPTTANDAIQALRWARVGSDDVLFDLGCGDGRVAVEAARLGARFVCVEKDASRARIAAKTISAAGFQEQVQILQSDLFDVDLSAATQLLPSFSALSPGARVVSRDYQVPGWPCGRRLALRESLFLMWVTPVVAASVAAPEVSQQQAAQCPETPGQTDVKSAAAMALRRLFFS
eukprot:6091196-Prymnesium_polylepis.1